MEIYKYRRRNTVREEKGKGKGEEGEKEEEEGEKEEEEYDAVDRIGEGKQRIDIRK